MSIESGTNPSTATEVVPTLGALFTAFLKIGLLGFGGVGALARHVIVVERDYLDDRAFAESYGVASTLPGANTVNFATMLGDRYRGAIGSVVALSGLLGVPLAIVIIVATLYARFSYLPDVRAGLIGAATAAAGLTIGTALKLLKSLDATFTSVTAAACVCIASALVKMPMLLILAVAVPSLLVIAIRKQRRRPA